jgi:hypothetical protein
VRVAVYDAATNWLGTAAAGADGAYAASGLPAPGPFFLATDANPLNYADVWYPDAPVLGPIIPDDAQAVSAPAGTITSNINMSLSEGGAVSGRVTDAALEPLPGVWVGTYDAGPQRVAATQAAADGTYTQNGLPAGSYFVRTEVDDSRYVDEWYDDVPAIGLGIPAAAASLTAWPGSLRAGVTFALSTGGAITGAVSDTHGAALPAVGVDAYDAHTNWVSGTTTAGDGGYSLSGLPTQTLYLVRTYTTANYVDEWFDDVPAPPAGIPFGAAPLALSTAHTAAAGFMLADGARLDGAVCDEAGSPLLDVGIELRATNSAWTALDATDGLGLYRFDKLPGGAYYLRTLWPELGFDNEWYDDIPVRGTNVPFEAAAVFVPAGGEGRADFALGFYVLQSGIPAGGRFQMQWQAASGTTYQVVRSANLLVWTNAPDGTNAWEQSRQRASAQELLRYEGPSGTNSTQYYRIVSFL